MSPHALTPKAWWRRGKFWRFLIGIPVGLALLLTSLLAYFAWQRNAFPISSKASSDEHLAEWWQSPPPLSDEEIAGQAWLSAISWQLPRDDWSQYWQVGGSQHGVFSIRYQAAFSGYAAAALGMRTPAYPALTGRILESLIDHLLDRQAWRYIGSYWKEHPTYPDPVAFENIMFTGHLLQLMALHEAITGDPRYRKEGFDLVWSAQETFHYDTLSLVDVTVAQMRGNSCGGISCEPGLVFFACNNHPQIALRLLEGMGLGDWSEDRSKWEEWALSSYRSVLGGGAFKYFHHLPSKAFVPLGHPAYDAWSLLWYEPWASHPKAAQELWKITKKKIDWKQFDEASLGPETLPKPGNDLYDPIKIPPSPVAATLAAAARVCGDETTAERLEQWLDERFHKQEGAVAWLDPHPEWRIGVTANRLLALAHAQGSSFRNLVQRPLPRPYFEGPLLVEVEPKDTPIFQAYRPDEHSLLIELDGRSAETTLTLAQVHQISSLEGIPEEDWSFNEGKLQLPKLGRTTLTIKVLP